MARRQDDFLSAVRALRREMPLGKPCSVRRCRVPNDRLGDCTTDGDRFWIRVSSRISREFQLHVLIHEWAHARAWPREDETHTDHEAHFGIEWARAFSALFDWAAE